MADLSYYQLLGVKEDATFDEIKKAYRRAARANHPDSGQPGAGALFPIIQEAWDTLGNESKRAEYDRKRSAPRLQQQSYRNPSPAPRPEPQMRYPSASEEAERARRQASQNDQQRLDREFQEARERERMQEASEAPPWPQQDQRPIGERLKDAPRKTLIMLGISAFLWLVWAALCSFIVAGIGRDGVVFALFAFFLTLGLTFLLVRFSRNLAPVYAFIFSAIVLPLPVAGLVTTGFSSTSWIFVVEIIGMATAFGDYFLRRPFTDLLAVRPRQRSAA